MKRFLIRRALCLLLAALVLLPALPAAAYGAEPPKGSVFAIYNDASGMAVSAEASGNKLAGVAAALDEDGRVIDAGSAAFTLEKTEGGVRFVCQGKYLTSGPTGGSLTLEAAPGKFSTWLLEDAGDGLYYIKNAAAAYKNNAQYLEYYNTFTTYSRYASAKPGPYAMSLRAINAEPQGPISYGLAAELNDGDEVIVYAPAAGLALTGKKSGYNLAGIPVSPEEGVIQTNEAAVVWTVHAEEGGYSLSQSADSVLSCYRNGSYVNISTDPAKSYVWTPELGKAETNSLRLFSAGLESTRENGRVYLEWYAAKKGFTVYDTGNPGDNANYLFQFYKKGAEPAKPEDLPYGNVLETGAELVIFSESEQKALGLPTEDSRGVSFGAVPAHPEGEGLYCSPGAYVFTVGKSWDGYYTFHTAEGYLCTNDKENLFLQSELTEYAQWYLEPNPAGNWLLYNRKAAYYNSPVCVQFHGGYFCGWTFGAKSDPEAFDLSFCALSAAVDVADGVTDSVAVSFLGRDAAPGRDYSFSLKADTVTQDQDIHVESLQCNGTDLTDYAIHDRELTATVPAAMITDSPMDLVWMLRLGDTRYVSGSASVIVNCGAQFDTPAPAPDSRTETERRPTISVHLESTEPLGTLNMTVNGAQVNAAYDADTGLYSYTPEEELPLGRTTVTVSAGHRPDSPLSDRVERISWSFVVGSDPGKLYFGQLHSHTGDYSDGVGTLAGALEHIAALPESANIDFLAFTDHSNYFDSKTEANPADALYDTARMTDASRTKWETYRSTVADFNAAQTDVVAMAGFEMTWSGGPGHINTFGTPGLVSRNNADLNNKTDDAGLQAYYALLSRPEGEGSISQLNHPGSTYGNFANFAYRNKATDERVFLLEVGNGEGPVGQGGYYPSYEEYNRALDMGWHVAPTNNQDNHKGRWGNANDARDVILADTFTEEGLYEAIRNLRVYATEDKNLSIYYTINGEPLGTVFDEVPEMLELVAQFSDPDPEDRIETVDLIVDGGEVAYTWDRADCAAELDAGQVELSFPSWFSYYYLRVTEADGDIAVTAPIWVGKPENVGISAVIASVNGLNLTLDTTLFSNMDSTATVKSLICTIDGSTVIASDFNEHEIAAGGTVTIPLSYTSPEPRRLTVTVHAVIECGGAEYTPTSEITVELGSVGDDEVQPISAVRAKGGSGYRFTVEGVVTSANRSFDADGAFYNDIYVQDETGGICLCVPGTEALGPGYRLRATGYTGSFMGELELDVVAYAVLEIGSPPKPQSVTAAQVSDGSTAGLLVSLSGTVTRVESVNGQLNFNVKDADGNTVQVLVEHYITPNTDLTVARRGQVSVTGLASSHYDTVLPPENVVWRLRVRDRAEVIYTPPDPEPYVPYYPPQPEPEPETPEPSPEPEPIEISFSDVTAEHWAAAEIAETVARGLFLGTGKDRFSPDAAMNRAMLVTVLWRLGGMPEVSAPMTFADVAEDAWYAEAIRWACSEGLVRGYDGVRFRPGDMLSREQAAVILYRFTRYCGLDAAATADLNAYPDCDAVSEWAADAMAWACGTGIIRGRPSGEIDPKGMATRAEMAVILMRYLDLIEQ